MKVNIGKGIELDVNANALPANALEHVIYIGLRNILMDSHASITRETNPDDLTEAATAMAEKKLAALMSGEVRVASSREGDPVKAEAIRIASERIKTALRKAGKKVSDYDSKVIREKAIELIGKDGSIMTLAREAVEARKAVDVDVSDLI